MDTELEQNKNVDLQLKGAHGNAAYNLTDKVSQNVGNTLANLWYLVFGGISEKAEEKKMRLGIKLQQYQSELQQAYSNVPEENRQDAPLQVVGPALEKSRYCVESDEIRKMFVNLIAKSMDKTYNTKVHPSFPEIISQMSPLDAQNLKLIYEAKYQLPIAKYRFNLVKEGSHKDVKPLVFLSNPEVQSVDLQASSITVLSRLGLLEVTFDEYVSESNAYDAFQTDPLLLAFKNMVPTEPEYGYQSPEDDDKIKECIMMKGLVRITPIGKDFASVCI
jgi:hypothetical protein